MTAGIIRGILAVIVFGGIGGYVIVQSVRKADDPARMIFKWILTAVILWILIILALFVPAVAGIRLLPSPW